MEADLVWSLDKARELVREYAIWPQFLGNRLALEAAASALNDPDLLPSEKTSKSATRGAALAWTLPAVVWPEQQRMMRKRVRNDAPTDQQPVLKRRKVESSSLWSFLSSLFHRAIVHLFPTAAIQQPPSNPDNIDEFSNNAPTPSSSFRDRVYTALRADGRVLGAGDVYGGDYAVYKDGDPSTTHSLATARLLPTDRILVRDLVAFARVQNQVAKSALLVFPSEPNVHAPPRALNFNFRAVSSR